MVHVADEMERRGLDLPLIGGATTSRQHTAVKIAPAYSQPTLHVLDASRVVGVVSDLLEPERRERLDRENRVKQDKLRELHSEKERKPLLPLARARERRTPIEWRAEDLPAPAFTGLRVVEPALAVLREYVDWTFFFHAWELKGRFPKILDDPVVGAAARELYENANELLDEIVAGELLQARGVYGFWPAVAEGDDVVLEGRPLPHAPPAGRARRFAPEPLAGGLRRAGRDRPRRPRGRVRRHRRARRRRARRPLRRRARRLPLDHGQGARRPAGRGVRGVCTSGEARVVRDRREALQGGADRRELPRHRPAFGYPACPDHSEKRTLFDLLEAEPAASS